MAFPHQPGWQPVDVEQLPESALPTKRGVSDRRQNCKAVQIVSERTPVRLVASWRQPRGRNMGKSVWTLLAATGNAREQDDVPWLALP
ncbi:MAG TPA: hypothetical protein VK157_07255, partial [Phycisphaerales bacterium]|nr:hypothetical protein [Phycisphaerales bacterium]